MSAPHPFPSASAFRRQAGLALLLCATVLAGCSSLPTPPPAAPSVAEPSPPAAPVSSTAKRYFTLEAERQSQEMVVYALGLLGTGYRFGGTNPDAGLDCSGMVGYIVEQVSGLRLPRSAAEIAAATRPIERSDLQPGDLVFFNTANRRHSHMGIYLGEGRFIHAPSSRGQVRVSRLDNPYFAPRFDGARTLLADN